MTDNYTGLFDGPINEAAITVNAIANEAIKIGSIVKWIVAPAGERLPRVGHPAAATEVMAGVVVGGENNGIWVDGTTANDGDAAAAAGERVRVCIHGFCKVRVEGTADVLFDAPLTYASDGVADTAVATNYILGRALQVGADPNTAIAMFVNHEGIF